MHKRTSRFSRRARWLMPAAALSLLGCPKQELAPLGPCTVSTVSERVDQTGISDVDLLFVIDNSSSMASEQVKLAIQLPRLVGVLTSGNKAYDPDRPDAPIEEENRFTPVTSLHLGVVSTNMGGMDTIPRNSGEAIASCQGLGDDAVLQRSTVIAREGVVSEGDIVDYPAGEVVLRPDTTCPVADQPAYQNYRVDQEPSAEAVAESFRCVSRLGVRGCPFEAQLEAMWKALAPTGTDTLHTFLGNTKGQGDGENRGFVRENAILAIMHVSDEEDCSITEKGKDLLRDLGDNSEFGPLNLRCGEYGDPAEGYVWPVERYIEGLKSLKPDNPDRIIFGAIVGIPTDAIGDPIPEVLARNDMKFAASEVNPQLPRSSCSTQERSDPTNPSSPLKINEAYPPRRFLQVAQGFGDQAVVYSICAADYGPALNLLIDRIASQLSGNCLPRQLNPSDEGLVSCEVYELIPKDVAEADATCTSERGHIGEKPTRRSVRAGSTVESRLACKMEQIAVTSEGGGPRRPDAAKRGWYYDDFSSDLMNCKAGEKQRISFQFGASNDLPSGAGATFECFQPVARIDANAEGIDAVNIRCVASSGERDQGVCDDASTKDPDTGAGYGLICIEGLNTCQIECSADPGCPPGWLCATVDGRSPGQAAEDGDSDTPTFCQLPTCPQIAPVSAAPVEDT